MASCKRVSVLVCTFPNFSRGLWSENKVKCGLCVSGSLFDGDLGFCKICIGRKTVAVAGLGEDWLDETVDFDQKIDLDDCTILQTDGVDCGAFLVVQVVIVVIIFIDVANCAALFPVLVNDSSRAWVTLSWIEGLPASMIFMRMSSFNPAMNSWCL